MKLPFLTNLSKLFNAYIKPPKPKIDMELYNKYKNILDDGKINTQLRLAHFFGQMKQESNLKPQTENLNYSVNALLSLFGRHRITVEETNKYGRKPGQRADQDALANILYGGSWGARNLGNTQKGDGARFKGRGLKQITGRANYTKLSHDTGIDFVSNPDLLLIEKYSMIGAVWFWNSNNLNRLADTDDVAAVTKVVNGGYNGLKERIRYTNEFKKIFKDV